MKLALSGIVLSAILLIFYSVIVISPLVWKSLVALVVLGILGLGILVFRNWSAEKKDLVQQQVKEEHERESQAQAKRNEKRMQEARSYLRFTKMDAIRDNREVSDDLLVNDLVVLMEQLQAENVSKGLIEEAIERFLTAVDENKKSIFLAVRQQILTSIISDTILNNKIMNEEKPEQPREFVS
jgi:arginine exporter protein ArgO